MSNTQPNKTSFVHLIAVLLSTAIFAFSANAKTPAKPQHLWINAEQKAQIKKLFDLNYLPIRYQYSKQDSGNEWILKEYGKEQLIDYRVRITNGAISSIQVMHYREPYGGEIKQSHFLKQFIGANLKPSQKSYALSNQIDGISGATISVNSTIRVAQLALYLDNQLQTKQ